MNKTGMKKYLNYMLLLLVCMVVALPVMHVNAQKSGYLIHVNRKQNTVIIYKKNAKGEYTVPVKAMVCSVGMQNRTPKGNFKLSERYRWRKLFYGTYGQYATRISGNILFHSVGYDRRDPASLQYREYNKLGTSASHGCVRLAVEDAKWIYDHCKKGTKVSIYDSSKKEPLDKPNAVKIPTNGKLKYWDPTDLNSKNPWRKVAPKLIIKKNDLEAGVSTKRDLLNMVSAVNFKGNAVKVSVKGDYDLTKIGKYEVTYTAVDYLGNKTEKTLLIRVGDTIAPVVSLVKQDTDIVVTESELAALAGEGQSLTQEVLEKWVKQFVVAKDRGETVDETGIQVKGLQTIIADYDAHDYKKEPYQVFVTATDSHGNKSERFILFIQYKDERYLSDTSFIR
ncbi:L,D-transpeptidase catalytic domain [Lachnospiraceae bacterium XBB1006]|nr:L,D-transpeptidase catalytic domain [Lachnospiraceae bacterium XBB1006]